MIGRRAKPSQPEVEKPKGFDAYDLRLGDVMRGERATLGKSLLDVQRELKIKATHIAAIENADIAAFEAQGFIAGYVRSYARYLGMDPDESFARFCREANFTVAHGMSPGASHTTISAVRSRKTAPGTDPLADPNALFVPRTEKWFSRIEPGAIGSVAVLLALIGALGYGGWSVLQEVQRVQLAPVDQAPEVVAEIDPLSNVQGDAPLVRSTAGSDLAMDDTAGTATRPDRADRMYRPEALDVPVLTSRDGPIASINPRQGQTATTSTGDFDLAGAIDSAVNEAVTGDGEVKVMAQNAPAVELLAVRPSWVRVSSADGTVLFEKILDAGERYVVPQFDEPAQLRAGNSGSVYFAVNGQTYGPAASGAQVVKGVKLSPETLTAKYAAADLSGDADLARYVTRVADASAQAPAVTD